MYKQLNDTVTLTLKNDVIQRVEDKAFIPVDSSNSDYKEYLAWVALGNTILPPE